MEGPDSLETVVQLLLRAVGDGVPDVNDIVFTGREDNWDVGMKQDSSDILGVSTIEGVQTLLGLVVPYLHLSIISSRDKVASLVVVAEVHAVYTSHMTCKTEVGMVLSGGHSPDLDGPIKRC